MLPGYYGSLYEKGVSRHVGLGWPCAGSATITPRVQEKEKKRLRHTRIFIFFERPTDFCFRYTLKCPRKTFLECPRYPIRITYRNSAQYKPDLRALGVARK